MVKHASDLGIKCLHLDFEKNYLINAGSSFLKQMNIDPNEGKKYSLTQILTLPYKQLVQSCKIAFENITAEIVSKESTYEGFFISLHPVYYHQQTLEFNSALINTELTKILNAKGLTVEYVISLHDDIYELYKFLLSDGRLLNPHLLEEELSIEKKKRDPLKDIKDLLFILKWRDHELTSSLNKSESLQARHLLFHNKGRISSLWRIIWEKKEHIYYSHPITQPRNDINSIPDPPKCIDPDPKRGEELIDQIQETANNISRIAPIIEPTSIDELRFDLIKLGKYTVSDLQKFVLPPLTKRWPIGTEDRLGKKHEMEFEKEFTEINPDIYPIEKFNFSQDSLSQYEQPLELLKTEILRQINVRDHILAYQADRIIAFRPYCHPDYPKPAGGVLEEIESLMRKIKLNVCYTKPALIVVHPKEDEKVRRQNELLLAWTDKLENMLSGEEHQKANLKDFISNEIADLSKTSDDIKSAIIEHFAKNPISIKKNRVSSSMDSTTLLQREELRKAFAAEVIDKTLIMRSAILRAHETHPDYVRIVENYISIDDLHEIIKALIVN